MLGGTKSEGRPSTGLLAKVDEESGTARNYT